VDEIGTTTARRRLAPSFLVARDEMNRERDEEEEKERLTTGPTGKLVFNQNFSLCFDRK
jgi:hypothetical protein